MIGGPSGCGLCPWSSSEEVGAYVLAMPGHLLFSTGVSDYT